MRPEPLDPDILNPEPLNPELLNKAELRARMRKLRRDIDEDERLRCSSAIGHHLISFLPLACGLKISLFLGMNEEIHTLPWLQRLDGAGITVALPRVRAMGEPLLMLRWRPGDPLERSSYGVEEPLASAPPVRPDIVIVPLLAFDRRGGRLGYGGGFYDRTLDQWHKEGLHPRRIGVAFSMQEVEEVPMDANDQRLDAVISETGPILISGRAG